MRIRALVIAVIAMGAFLTIPVTPAVSATTFVVNSTGDGGDVNPADGICDDGTVVAPPPVLAHPNCTLRAAIEQANALPEPDTIAFNILGEGVHTISPGSRLPTITDTVTIDGYTQPGAREASQLTDSVLLIELSGVNAGREASALDIRADSTIVRGLVINGFAYQAPLVSPAVERAAGVSPEWPAIRVTGNFIRIEGNFIGTDVAGTGPGWNGGDGVRILTGSSNWVSGNLVSANGGNGIAIVDADGSKLRNNLIGTDVSGTVDGGNGLSGILILSDTQPSSQNVIGGDEFDRNVVSANGRMGIEVTGTRSYGNLIAGNYIGTDVTGTKRLGNTLGGVSVQDAQEWYDANYIGGSWDSANVISANGGPGIHIKGSSANVIAGNYIGTDASGSSAVGNLGGGILLEGSPGNTIGAYGTFNLISGNIGAGIEIRSQGALWDSISSNLIGTNAEGTAALGNTVGVKLIDTEGVSVGSVEANRRNIISGNTEAGVVIEGASSFDNRVFGNYIGTNYMGTAAVPNGTGVRISGGYTHSIGGPFPGDGNIISGNVAHGVNIRGGQYHFIAGNFIGTDPSGTAALPNGLDGLAIDGSHENLIGREDPSARNIISGNGRHGISVVGASFNNQIENNYVGTNAGGDAAVGNGGAGIRIVDGWVTRVGSREAGNVVSGNHGRGIEIEQTAAGSGFTPTAELKGNKIGSDPTGTRAIGNLGDGIALINTQDIYLGGAHTGGWNLISGNGGAGVLITGAGAYNNTIEGQYIGTNAAGDAAIGNAGPGVRILDGFYNRVGTPFLGNLISGNNGPGVEIVETPATGEATGNSVVANLIGTNADGTAPVGNRDGVVIVDAYGNEVGSVDAAEPNVISGNGTGVVIKGPVAYNNSVVGNYIGTNQAGTAAVGNGIAALIEGSSGSQIGGSDARARNIISGNDVGIEIRGEGSSNVVLGNHIGLNAAGQPLGNAGAGVRVTNLAFDNTIGGTQPGEANLIAHNGGDGVVIDNSGDITIRGNSIYSNAGKGIETTNGGNGERAPPVITSIGSASGTIECGSCTIDVYSDNEDEGRIYHGSTVADGFGNWNFAGEVVGPNVTATATDGGGNTSEFSLPLACIDIDADGTCDIAHPDYDRDGVHDEDELACGGDPRDRSSRPERLDGLFAGVDDDGDLEIDEPIHFETSYYYDCDGDGYTGRAESAVGTGDQDPCGQNGWPSDLYPAGLRPNQLSLEDLGSFVVPVRRLGTSPGDPGFSARWDLEPGSNSGPTIDIEDMAKTITGSSGYPPMVGGQRAFGRTCPWAP